MKTVHADLEALRQEMHAAVDNVINRFSKEQVEESAAANPEVVGEEAIGRWRFRWPDGQSEEFSSGRTYTVTSRKGPATLRLVWTVRKAWGRDRERAVIFLDLGSRRRENFYPLAEFVETDEGGFAASIPNPTRPRALLAHGAEVPDRFCGLRVERADTLFRGMEKGMSLRVVLARDDEVQMIRHACWVAELRGRF